MAVSPSKHRKFVEEIIGTLVKLGLEVSKRRDKNYIFLTGTLNGYPYTQRFSKTPSDINVAKAIIAETIRNLKKCGVERANLRDELPSVSFVTPFTTKPTPDDIFYILEQWQQEIETN